MTEYMWPPVKAGTGDSQRYGLAGDCLAHHAVGYGQGIDGNHDVGRHDEIVKEGAGVAARVRGGTSGHVRARDQGATRRHQAGGRHGQVGRAAGLNVGDGVVIAGDHELVGEGGRFAGRGGNGRRGALRDGADRQREGELPFIAVGVGGGSRSAVRTFGERTVGGHQTGGRHGQARTATRLDVGHGAVRPGRRKLFGEGGGARHRYRGREGSALRNGAHRQSKGKGAAVVIGVAGGARRDVGAGRQGAAGGDETGGRDREVWTAARLDEGDGSHVAHHG